MNALRLAMAAVVLGLSLTGCSNSPVAVATYRTAAPVADRDGWYTIDATAFKGRLVDGKPDGFGQCRTHYANSTNRYDKSTELVEAPCEFRNGQRVDEYHLTRVQTSIDRYQVQRKGELDDQRRQNEEYAAYRHAEAARQREYDNARIASALNQTAARMQQNAQTLAENRERPTQRLPSAVEVNNQRQLDANEAARRRQREAEEAALQRTKDRQSAAQAGATQRQAESDLKVAQAAEAKKQQDQAQAARDAREAEQKRLQDQRDAEAKRAKDKADREAAKAKEKADEEAAKQKYLRDVAMRTKLFARTCPSGDGAYYVVGTRPRIKPEVVACVDVHFAARCEGSGVASTGVANNFVGAATDCFMGDTYKVEPKPACPVKSVRVEVREVRVCGG